MPRSLGSMTKTAFEILRREIDFYTRRLSAASCEITYVCNLHCLMCDFGQVARRAESELQLQEWKTVLTSLLKMGVRWINFIGAEPLVRQDDVLELARFLEHRGVFRQLNTNGTMVAPPLAREVVRLFDNVAVSLDGPRETHDAIRGCAGTFEKVCKGIQTILEARRQTDGKSARITLHTTVTNRNYDVLRDVIQVAEALGADVVTFQYVSQTPADCVSRTVCDGTVIASSRYVLGNGESLYLNRDQISKLREQIRRIQGETHRIQVDLGFLPYLSDACLLGEGFPVKRCYFTRVKAVISPWGDVGICSHLDYSLGNVRQQPFETIWKNGRHKRLTKLLGEKLVPVCPYCCHFSANLSLRQYWQLARRRPLD